jgi:Peptidase family M1 domain
MPSLLLGVTALLQVAAPGPKSAYWQQDVRYEIQASLNEAAGVLSGTQRMFYHNNSPDTLGTISFHLHLNAFRPGSRWADADSAERRRRFNDLKDPDFAFNHVKNVRIAGRPVEPIWPLAPDSTIVRFVLPAPLAPGGSVTVELEWEARPSTLPRRQGRRGRAFDFAQWYPKVVVYDRFGWEEQALYPGGEFYGEFATYLVDLDVPADQVVGATGVPLCGDPGWEGANQVPDRPIQYRRDFYPGAPKDVGRGDTCVPEGAGAAGGAEPGRKRIVWYAENVHHFAMSMNPQYRYEGSAWGNVAIHVLYQPGDEASWGRGIATGRTAKALEWLDGFFGEFAWPQITNVHRIEGGGTEFPMMIHDGSASQGLIVHELGHNYVMGILANNEWKEGYLDEGFTSFQTSLFFESQQPGSDAFSGAEGFITGLDLDGRSEPTSLVSQDYRDFNTYNTTIYTRGEIFFHQLRYIVGDDNLRRIMRTYYDRWKLKHVSEAAFKEVAEEVSGMDLSTYFGQALHSVVLTDYAVGRVRVARRSGGPADGGWESKIEVLRKADGTIPVEVWVLAEHDTAVVRTDGLAHAAWVTVATRSKPKEILLDPRVRTRDWNMLNNVYRRGWLGPVRRPREKAYLDTWFSERRARDRISHGWLPTAWYNDAAGLTFGLRGRENYFGRFERNLEMVSVGTGAESDDDVKDVDFFLRFQNPVWLQSPGMTQTLEGYNVEGRFGARIAVEKSSQFHLGWGPTRTVSGSLTWMQPDDLRYLDPGYYEDAGVAELQVGAGVTDRTGPWSLALRTSAAGGIAYNRRGLSGALGRSDAPGQYGRFTLEATARRALGKHWLFGGRLYGGITTGTEAVVKQRQIYLAGADPFEQFGNPFLRSSGALLVRPDVYYTQPGGAGLRGFDPRLSTAGAVAINAELERTLLDRPRAKLFRRVGIALFGDAGHAIRDGMFGRGDRLEFLGDAGVGIRAEHRIGETRFTTRVDFPLLVSRPEFAQDTDPGNEKAGFRWQFSFSPAF